MRAIDKFLREIALKTTGVKAYGHGGKSFANVFESETPRIWIYTIKPVDKIVFGSLSTIYTIIGEVTKTHDFDADEDGTLFDNVLAEIEPIYEMFVTNVAKDSRVLAISNLNRTEIIHTGDANLGGFAFSFDVQIKKTYATQCL
jgi:hypothetical protein